MAKKLKHVFAETRLGLVRRVKTTVKVTEADIANGRCGDSRGCAVALAVNRVCGKEDAEVAGSDIAFGEYIREEGVANGLDKKLNRFISKFDELDTTEPGTKERKALAKKKKVLPFAFELVLDAEVGPIPVDICQQ